MRTLNVITLLCILTYAVNAQQNEAAPVLTLQYHYTSKKIPDSLSIWTYPANNYWETGIDYMVHPETEGGFSFKFPAIKSILNYRINQAEGSRHTMIGIYFAQPGDKIRLDVYETKGDDSLVFSGKGSVKYNLTEKLIKEENEINRSLTYPDKTATTEQLKVSLTQLLERMQKAILSKQQVIDRASKATGENMAQLIGYQNANYDSDWTNYLWALRSRFSASPQHLQLIKDHFNQHYGAFLDESTEMSLYSERHYQLLLNMLCYDLLFNSENGDVDLRETYHKIKEYTNNQKIRDRIMCQFFAYDGNMNTKISENVLDSLVKDAVPYMQSKMAKKILNNKLLYKKGSPLFDAAFTNLDGQPFHTSSLRGKAFLIDVWGEGCSQCVLFHNWFEDKVWPSVKDLENFQVLSIFDGKDMVTWKQLMSGGKYTSGHYLNVSDVPMRMANHPFFKHYEVNYAPFLLLVDKQGKLVTRIRTSPSPEEFIKMIRELANQP